jgi:hypothetical protein
MKVCLFILVFLWDAFIYAQAPTTTIIMHHLDLHVGSDLGPLCFKTIDRENMWISVDWDPKTSENDRRNDGKLPKKDAMGPSLLRIQLDYIEPRFSSDPAERQQFKEVFAHGVEELLKGGRPFWFEVTNDQYEGPGEIGGVILLDVGWGPNLQAEMINRGFATVRGRHDWDMVEKYMDSYRDDLLRSEGEARALKLGVWSKP